MEIVGLAVIIHFQYSITVNLLGGAGLTMAFRENGVLAEVLAHKMKDR